MRIDERVARCYEATDEDKRLWQPGRGDLLRLRTWDIFGRVLPPTGRVLDVGGGPGAHAAHLASAGYQVLTIDPLQHHVEMAAGRSAGQGKAFSVAAGEARDLPVRNNSMDVVLLMGPLYHLTEDNQRRAALCQARRCLKPGGLLIVEAITRHAWVLDATKNDLLATPGVWEQFDRNIQTGLSQHPTRDTGHGFFAYLHSPGQLQDEVTEADFTDVELLAVEGFGWLLGDLERRMKADPEPLLRAIRLTETEPTMLGASAHVIAIGKTPTP